MSFTQFVAMRYLAGSGALSLLARFHAVVASLLVAFGLVRHFYPQATLLAAIGAAVCLLVIVLAYLLTFRSHVALISTISMLGVEVGVAALIISLALLSGFQDRIRRQMTERGPHLVISPERGERLADPERVASVLSSVSQVISSDPVVEGRGWASDVEGRGATPIRYRNGPRSLRAAESESSEAPPAFISSPAAGRTGATVGSLLRVLSSQTRLSPIGPIPIETVVRVAQIRRGNALEKTAEVEVPEATARLLAGLPTGARAYEASLVDPQQAESVAHRVAAALGPGYRVQTWGDLNAPLGFALRLEKAVIFATVALIIVVAALNIVSNIALLVIEKKRNLGVLMSMGASSRSVIRIYVTLGAAIGAVGTVAGIVVGVGVSILGERLEFIPLPADMYSLSHIPFAVHGGEVLLVAMFAWATALAAAVLPARSAARLAPGEAIRLSR
jgi:lipoprotein-releasing system permease protein